MNEIEIINHYNILEYKLVPGMDRINKDVFNRDMNKNISIITKKFNNCSYRFTRYKIISVNNERIVFIPTIRDRIVLNIIKDHIQNKYHIKYKNRQYEISKIIDILKDNIPVTLIRLDVKEYFNSINKSTLITKLNNTNLLGSREYAIVVNALKQLTKGVGQGLPISNSLAEIYFESLDWELKRLSQNVVFYSRYVDDIIIILNGNSSEVELNELRNTIKEMFKKVQLDLNENKSMIANLSDTKRFVYLGYQFDRIENIGKKGKYEIELKISVSQKKYNKECKKIISCFKDYALTNNFELLRQRISVLTHRNYIYKSKTTVDEQGHKQNNSRKICFGFIENYKQINDLKCLENLDKFLAKNIYKYITDKRKRQILFKHSYLTNFKKRYYNDFTQKSNSEFIVLMQDANIIQPLDEENDEHFFNYYNTLDISELQLQYLKGILCIFKNC